jgi:nicotinate-nucleotide adenylyltransferase
VPSLVGIFGGTFDPIHFGHLRLAEELGDSLGLDEVRIIPARVPPHRSSPRVTSEHRLEMTRLAVAGNPRFVLDDRECRREGPSYTVDTLLELRAERGDPDHFCLLMGVDAFMLLTTWSRWRQLFELAHIVIAHRPGFELKVEGMSDDLGREVDTRLSWDVSRLRARPAGLVLAHRIAGLEISGTAIRAGLREGRSQRYLLPDSVLDYIDRNHLYQELDAG